jgi:hypothetical protein
MENIYIGRYSKFIAVTAKMLGFDFLPLNTGQSRLITEVV